MINVHELKVQHRKTCAILCTVFDDNGLSIEGALITAQLSSFDVDKGYITPILTQVTTDDNGEATLILWPNQLGATSSYYKVKIIAPNGKTLNLDVTVPDQASARLEEIALLPPYPGKPDGFLIVDECLAAAARAEQAASQAGASAYAAGQSVIESAKNADLAKQYAEAGRACATIGSFGRVLKPQDLPASGLLKADSDGPGFPPIDIQFLQGQGLLYSESDPSDPLHNHLFSFVGQSISGTGWVDIGNFSGPKGDKGDKGDNGKDGRSVTVILAFGAAKRPGDLPKNGLIPAGWDGANYPKVDTQLQVGEGMIYSRCSPNTPGYKQVWAYVGSDASDTGWSNYGNIYGPPNTLTVGTVAVVPYGTAPKVTITGESPEQVINFELETGPQGVPGKDGPPGKDGAPYVGEVRMFVPTATLPAGWYVCDGANGTIDLRDRFVMAAGPVYTAGSTGGSHTITTANLPSHDHGGAVLSANTDHVHNMGSQQVDITGAATGPAGGHSHVYQRASGVAAGKGGGSTSAIALIKDPPPNANTTGVGDHTHTINGKVTIAGNTGGMSANASHAHGIPAEGGGQDYVQPYYALVFAQYMGV